MLNLKNNVNFFFVQNRRKLNFNKFCFFKISIDYKKNFNENKLLIKTNRLYFSDNSKKENDQSDPNIKRYNYDYEAPEDSDFEYKSEIKRVLRFLLRLTVFSFGIYFFFFRKLNLITKKYQLYFLNETLELKISDYFSKKIQRIYEHYIHKHDTEEVNFVLEVYKILLEKNNTKCDFISKENIFVIESETIGCLMLKNGDLFISSRLIQIANNNPNYLAFFIACEVASQAMGLNSSRIFKIIFDLKTKNSIFRYKIKNSEQEELPKFTIIDKKFKELEFNNRFLFFYPESIIMNYFEEKELLKISLRILNKANFSLDEVFKYVDFIFI